MDMPTYLAEMQPVIGPVITSVWSEEHRVRAARAAVAVAQAAIDDNVRRMEWLNDNPDLDDDGLGTFLKWDTHFEALPAHDKAGSGLNRSATANGGFGFFSWRIERRAVAVCKARNLDCARFTRRSPSRADSGPARSASRCGLGRTQPRTSLGVWHAACQLYASSRH